MFMVDLSEESLYSKLGLPSDATSEQINMKCDEIGKKLVNELRDAAGNPELKKQIEARQMEMNAISNTLTRPKEREKYDKQHTHLRFFLPQSAAIPLFANKVDRVAVLHRVIVAFLAEKGVTLAPLSDIDRLDFTTDETPLNLLDDLLL